MWRDTNVTVRGLKRLYGYTARSVGRDTNKTFCAPFDIPSKRKGGFAPKALPMTPSEKPSSGHERTLSSSKPSIHEKPAVAAAQQAHSKGRPVLNSEEKLMNCSTEKRRQNGEARR